MSDDLTIEVLHRAAPKSVRNQITQKTVDTINTALSDSAELHIYRENILGYLEVMKTGKFKISDYINAVKYCSLKLLGSTNVEAYTKTFPERYQYFLDNDTEDRHIGGHISLYNKGVLVSKIMEQSLVPIHIINADLHQKSINHLAYLMLHAKSEKVQGDSAAKLADILKMPETLKVELDIGIIEDDSIKELRETTLELVRQQKLAIEAGANTVKEIAHSKIIGNIAEIEDVEVVEIVELKEVE